MLMQIPELVKVFFCIINCQGYIIFKSDIKQMSLFMFTEVQTFGRIFY